MKKHTGIWNVTFRIFPLVILLVLFSCEKAEYEQTFDDVFDTSGIINVNKTIDNASNIAEFSLTIDESLAMQVPQSLQDISLNEMITHYENNIQLSSDEVDLLLKNDYQTFIIVISRIVSIPGEEVGLTGNFTKLESSSLEKYLLRQKSEINNFYGDNYYAIVVALQDHLNADLIHPLKKLNNLVQMEETGTKSAEIISGKGYTSNNLNVYKYINCHYKWFVWNIVWHYYYNHLNHSGGSGDV